MKSVTFLLIIFTIGSCSLITNHSEGQYEEAKKISKEYVQNYYQNVSEVEITSVEDSPMSEIDVHGMVNKAEFTELVNTDSQGNLSIGGLSSNAGFPELKPECRNSSYD